MAPSSTVRLPRATIWTAKIAAISNMPSSSRRVGASWNDAAGWPRRRAMNATTSGRAVAPVSRSRVAPVRLAVTSSVCPM